MNCLPQGVFSLSIECLDSINVDYPWLNDYRTNLGAVPTPKPLHELNEYFNESTLYRVPKARLKEWQKYLAEEQTCFKLASALIDKGSLDTIHKIKGVLLLHYKNLVKRRFPTNLSYEFQQTITAEGNIGIFCFSMFNINFRRAVNY